MLSVINEAPKFPDFIEIDLDSVPTWLTDIPQWVGWCYSYKPAASKPWTKPPVQFTPDGVKFASTNNSATWRDFETAAAGYHDHKGEEVTFPKADFPAMVAGLGIVLTADLGIIGIDLDHALDEYRQPLPWVGSILRELKAAGAYIEVSPSGTGLRSFVRAALPEGRAAKGNNIEVYASGRYLTVTGAALPDSGRELVSGDDVDSLVQYIWSCASHREDDDGHCDDEVPPLFQRVDENDTAAQVPHLGTAAEVLEVARRATNAAEIFAVFDGGYPAGSDRSSVDQTLANQLAFYTGDNEALLDSVMRQSALLADRERVGKWDKQHFSTGETYGQRTCRNAIRMCAGKFYAPRPRPVMRADSRPKAAAKAAATPQSKQREPAPPPGAHVSGKPIILYGHNHPVLSVPHRAAQCVADIEKAMSGELFTFAGHVAHLTPVPMDYHDRRRARAVKFPAGMLTVSITNEKALFKLVDRSTVGMRYLAKTNEWVTCPPDTRIIAEVLEVDGETALPPLTGLTACPLFILGDDRHSYRILARHGYDRETGIFCDLPSQGYEGLNLDREITHDELVEARNTLLGAVSEFPFSDDPSRAVAIAALLAPLVRPVLPTAPMIAITAPVAGTGKTQLALLVNILATGRDSAVMLAYSTDQAEFKKAIDSVLLSSSPVSVIDNVPNGTVFKHPALEQVMTSRTANPRIFGTHNLKSISTTTQWIITGNGLSVVADMIRRTLLCNLDSGEERPQFRRFNRNLTSWAIEHRTELVTAGLTILAGYVRAKMPSWSGYIPLASFEEWSDLVRRATWWILSLDSGKSEQDSVLAFDPVQSQHEIEKRDPIRQSVEIVVECWLQRFGHKDVTAADLAALTVPRMTDSAETSALGEALRNAVPHRGDSINSAAMGWWLRSLRDQIIRGVRVTSRGRDKQGVHWALIPV